MYEIWAKYGDGDDGYFIPGADDSPWEMIDEAATEEEAQFLVQEYALAFGPDWTFHIHKIPLL